MHLPLMIQAPDVDVVLRPAWPLLPHLATCRELPRQDPGERSSRPASVQAG